MYGKSSRRHITSSVSSCLDNKQFAYIRLNCTGDVTVAFTSALNHTNTYSYAVTFGSWGKWRHHWIRDFLSDHCQRSIVDSTVSGEIVFNTGGPLGTILSPLLFFICIHKCKIDHVHFSLLK